MALSCESYDNSFLGQASLARWLFTFENVPALARGPASALDDLVRAGSESDSFVGGHPPYSS